jgi:putative ubiquitin-RnfH superfamily antitoxin RatB of RatAB toxin-antitoxin module
MADSFINVEVAYAAFAEQVIIRLQVIQGSTVEDAIELSKILSHFPEIDLAKTKVGIFSQLCQLDKVLKPQDRVEIYRPLLCDPMQTRRLRAAKKAT